MLRRFSRKKRSSGEGQVLLEFTFSMIIIMLMIYAVVKIFQWAGTDMAGRLIGHEKGFTQLSTIEYQGGVTEVLNGGGTCGEYYRYCTLPPFKESIKQIDPYFYQPLKLNAVWKGY